jgi:hypothetical protein
MDLDLATVQNAPLVFPAHVAVRTLLGVDKLKELAAARGGTIESTVEIEDENDEEYYFWSAQISNNDLDAYYTRMNPSSLKNYAAAANEGVAFMTSHDTRRLPLGHSLYGKYTSPSGNGRARVEADFYTIRDYDANGVNTDQFYRAVKNGIVRDVSIGFYGGQWICNICNRDMMAWGDWENMCWHIPGVSYALKDQAGNKTDERIVCEADIRNANLSEVSAVYDGATPGASIRKAALLAEAGKLPEPLARNIESFYMNRMGLRFRLPVTRQFGGATPSDQEDAGMPMPEETNERTVPAIAEAEETDEVRTPAEEQRETPVEETTPPAEKQRETPAEPTIESAPVAEPERAAPAEEIQTPAPAEETRTPTTDPAPAPTADARRDQQEARVEPEGDSGDMALTEDIRAVFSNAGIADLSDDPVTAARAIVSEIERLRPLADMGRAYRSDLIEETLNEGVAAFGEKFPREQRAATFAKLDIDEIKGYLEEYRTIANGTFKAGRATGDGEDEQQAEPKASKGRNIPDDAFRTS